MNSINNKSRKRSLSKVIIVISVILLFLVVGFTVYAHKMRIWPFSTKNSPASSATDYNPPSKEQSSATGSTKQPSNPTESTGSDPLPKPSPSSTGQKPTVGMSITAVTQTNSGLLYVRTLIETISSGGICTLRMTGPDNRLYTATAESQANPSSTTCKGFDVPISSLAPGSWHVSITYDDPSVQASASKDITVR